MKRDMALIREILEKVEPLGEGFWVFEAKEFDDRYTQEQIEYHVRLCRSISLVDGPSNMGEAVGQLTWAGHDELERMRAS